MDDFARACKDAARQLRRLPRDVRQELATEVRDAVAEPLAAAIRADWRGPHAAVLAAGTKTRVQVDPMVVVGGARKVVSGGAGVRDLVFGNEFGGGKRVALVGRPKSNGRRRRGKVTAAEASGSRIYRRRTTRQFPVEGQHSVFGTIEGTLDATFDRWVDVINRRIDRSLDSGS